MQRSDIEWTTFTANPIKYRAGGDSAVWACVKTSPGCANCYAEAIALRFRRGEAFTAANMRSLTPYLDDAECRKILTAKKIGGVPVSGSRCFIGDMTDIFGEWVTDAMLDRLFAVFALRPDVTFQVLTKRAERMAEYVAATYRSGAIQDACRLSFDRMDFVVGCEMPWPLPNVWLGVSVEDQQRADERIPHLLRTPAAVRFLSCEPLLGPVDLCFAVPSSDGFIATEEGPIHVDDGADRVNWVIVGGESGPKARPCDIEWIRGIVRQCAAADVPCFVKQLGSNAMAWDKYADGFGGITGGGGDRKYWTEDSKGGDPAEWPDDLRVRQFPQTKAATL